jgi:phosphotransacetylase
MVNYSVKMAKALDIETPKVALISATEKGFPGDALIPSIMP